MWKALAARKWPSSCTKMSSASPRTATTSVQCPVATSATIADEQQQPQGEGLRRSAGRRAVRLVRVRGLAQRLLCRRSSRGGCLTFRGRLHRRHTRARSQRSPRRPDRRRSRLVRSACLERLGAARRACASQANTSSRLAIALVAAALEHPLDERRRSPRKPMRPSRKACTATSLAAFSAMGAAAPAPPPPRAACGRPRRGRPPRRPRAPGRGSGTSPCRARRR